jgi:molybdenum cofactor cytidylyltransferase
MPDAAPDSRAPAGTAAVVLAAGSSTRMGQNKLLLALDGQPLVVRAVRAAAAAGLAPVVVVLGHEAEQVRAALDVDGIAYRALLNADHARGQGTSLQAGIAEVERATDAAAAVIMLADMPFVSAAMLAAVARAALRDGGGVGAPMVISRYGGQVNAPPILYDRALFAELCALPAHACGKQMQRLHRHEAVFLEWPETALTDVDDPDDYRRLRDGHVDGGWQGGPCGAS